MRPASQFQTGPRETWRRLDVLARASLATVRIMSSRRPAAGVRTDSSPTARPGTSLFGRMA